MKNISKVLVVLLLAATVLTFVGCTPYAEEAGVYECYEITLNGVNAMSQFEYYRITLNADGSCIVESKGAGQSTTYEAEATFSIEGDKITVVTRPGVATVTEVYDYIDGEIIMNATAQGVTMNAKFARKTAE